MLRLWRDRVLLVLSPDQVSAVLIRRDLIKPRVITQKNIILDNQSDETTLTSIVNILSDIGAIGKPLIEVVISSHYLRMIVVPGSKALKNQSQRDTLAKIQFNKTFGDTSEPWELTVSPMVLSHPTLACSLPTHLLTQLRQVIAAYGKLYSVNPLWMKFCNQYRSLILKQNGLLVAIEPQRIVMGSLKGGHWQSITGRFVDTENQEAIQTAISQQLALDDSTSKQNVWLYNFTKQPVIAAFPGAELHNLTLPGATKEIAETLLAWDDLSA